MTTHKTFTNPRLPLTFRYPDPTPGGCHVSINEKSGKIGYRVHLISEGSDEIYFEVGRYHNTTVSDAIERFQREASANIADLNFGRIEESVFTGRPASRVLIGWPGKKRVITFLEKDGYVYRIIYDPASPLNEQMLATVEFM